MGCDIHPYVERIGDDGSWEIVRPFEAKLRPGYIRENGIPLEFDLDRDYRLFSLLADVRNYDEGEDGYIKPLAKVRGIPLDLSHELFQTFVEWGEHTPTWFLLSELMAPGALDCMRKLHDGQGSELDKEMLPALIKLSRNGKGTDVRLVIWFDN